MTCHVGDELEEYMCIYIYCVCVFVCMILEKFCELSNIAQGMFELKATRCWEEKKSLFTRKVFSPEVPVVYPDVSWKVAIP